MGRANVCDDCRFWRHRSWYPKNFDQIATARNAHLMTIEVFVVVDTKGAGRVVGVFERNEIAMRIQAVNPHYYKVVQISLNHLNPECLTWLADDEQKRSLLALAHQPNAA